MRFNLLRFAAPALTAISLMSCGLLGSKNVPVADSGQVGNSGCLNNANDLVSRYVAGQVSPTEWKSAFDCVNQSLDFFTQYVRGNTQDTYSTSDMYTLVSKFLITNNPVHEALLTSAFSLKAAVFGGNDTDFKKEEIELLKTTLGRLRDITGDLVPYLAIRQQANPSFEQLQEVVSAFQRAGDQLADLMGTLPTGMLSDTAVQTLINELVVSMNLPAIDDLSQTIFLVKWVLFNTRRDAVEVTDWPIVMKTAMGLGGVIVAYKAAVGTDPNDPRADVMARFKDDYRFREFVLALAEAVRPYFNDMITRHGGATPLPLFDHLIDQLPDSLLDNLPKDTLKQTLRPLIHKLLISQSQIGLDKPAVDTVFGLMEDMIKDFGLLDRFYEASGLDVNSATPAATTLALNQYYASLNPNDQVRFAIIKTKLTTYAPLFYRDTGRIRFDVNLGYSKTQHFAVLGLDRVVRHLLKTYGSGPDYFSDDDLSAFFHEYQDILFAIKAVDPTVSDFGPKRKQDIDLFTPISNGDGLAQVPEIVNYMMMIISATNMTNDMRDRITPVCDVGLGVDLMGWTRLPADCFRRQFNQQLGSWLTQFPRLQKYWSTLTPAEQAQAMVWIEHAARRNGYTNVEFDKFDINSMATVLHYTESLFTRFDMNYSEVLTKDEVKNAYPVFKLLLAKKGNIAAGNDFMLKAIFSYIVKYRAMPQTSGVGNLAKFGVWLLTYGLPTTNYTADRLGVFNIVCQLAMPETASQQDLTKTICKQ